MLPDKLIIFIEEVRMTSEVRKASYKSDAYFDIPDDISHDEIKIVIKRLEDEYGVLSRLYNPRRLQTFFDYCPRTNMYEYLCGTGPIIDPDLSLAFHNKVIEQLQQTEKSTELQ